MEIIHQTQKRTHIVHIFREWPRVNGLNFPGVGANFLLIHYVAQVLNLCLSEARLCFTNEKLFSIKRFENKTQMRLMLSFGPRENQDVINIDNNKLPDVRVKNRIHHRLKSGWGVCQALNQHFKLEMTKGWPERRFRPILFKNQYLMVSQCQVQRHEESTSRHCV
jgi:hypothetical protein